MEITNSYDKDTHGGLTSSILKILPENACMTSSIIKNAGGEPAVKIVYDNIDFAYIPSGTSNMSYKFLLGYMGTMGREQLYTQIVKNEDGKLNVSVPPSFEYTVNGLMYPPNTDPNQVVLNVNFYTGEANILQFKGVPVGGNNSPFQAVYKYTYPFTMESLPNRDNKNTYLDGWYQSTFVLLRDVSDGNLATKDQLYGFDGTTGLATTDGIFKIDETGILRILNPAGELVEAFNKNSSYQEVMLAIMQLSDSNSLSAGMFADTQTLITEEINSAIVNELKDIASDPSCDKTCSIADWQKLQQKKLGAFIHFTEGNFRKAQIILESARRTCSNSNTKYCKK